MGQVFTWDAVRRGHVPQLESFDRVIDSLRREITTVPSIVGAIVCGSVTRGDHTVRSDIDCFVLYDHRHDRAVFSYMQEASDHAAAQHVPLNFIPCDTLLAETRMHHIGISFAQHLQKSIDAGGLLKGNPLALITPSIHVRDELESYMRKKMHTLQENWSQISTFSEERVASYLRKLLEAPLHIARKVLAHREPLSLDSKAYIRKRYRSSMPVDLVSRLDYLIAADEWYTDELYKALAHPNRHAYRSVLTKLVDLSPRVLRFVRSNLACIAATPC
jgi:predicted nucleotidyltransferase